MTHSIRTRLTILVLTCAALAPAGARAQAHPKATTQAQGDSLTPQEKEFLALANGLAQRCVAAMERWIANKEITEEKLTSSFYYPIPNTDPPKYNTDWDRLSDRDILPLEESVSMKSPTIIYALIVDRNGYIPTHLSRFAQPLTGNHAVDLVNNRTKILAQHLVGWNAARSEAPFLIQKYHRDTGESLAELSVPLYLHGVHWGAVRLAYRPVDARVVASP